MAHSANLCLRGWRSFHLAASFILAILAGLALSVNLASAQEDADDEEDEVLELEDVRVTGSRLSRSPSEISGNLIVLDRDDIRASGELTLARLLRQLPQNANPTNETYGSLLNTAGNKTGAATVNLRGLGSESTLILVDGRRVGYSGILGGVTDISTIPLSMVERVEILLDGASAVYGSDAVGGVVNIITRQDYSGVELDINYSRPHKSGYDERKVSLATGLAWSGGRARFGFEHFRDSGLDASQRDSAVIPLRTDLGYTPGNKQAAAGPQWRIFSHRTSGDCPPPPHRTNRLAQLPVLWELADGSKVTHADYLALDEAGKANATCREDVTLPLGFQHTDDLNSIELFGEQHWRGEAEVGYSLRPEQGYDTVNLGVDQQLTDSLALHANLRMTRKDSNSGNGLNATSSLGTQILHERNPFNPFGVQVRIVGLLVGTPPRTYESQTDEMFARLGAEGSLGSWTWQAEYRSSRQEIDTTRYNVLDGSYTPGLNSDGVTGAAIAFLLRVTEEQCEARRVELGGWSYTYTPNPFFIGICRVLGQPPDPVNPFADANPYIIPGLDAESKNEQTQFEALARGNLFNAPGGPVALAVGYDYRQDVLDSFSELALLGTFLSNDTPTGYTAFNTRISRDSHAGFVEGLVPLVGSGNAMAGVQQLSLTFSGRFDSYSSAEVEYGQSSNGEAGTLDADDPGSEFTWSGGLVYRPNGAMQFRAKFGTSFVAPQLNQLLQRVERVDPTLGLFVYIDENGEFVIQRGNVVRLRGGNDTLVAETADNLSLVGEFTPPFVPGLFLKVGWSDTEFSNRISKLSTGIVEDLNNLPPTLTYLPDDDLYVLDDRWINSYAVNRSGVDYELRYEWSRGLNNFEVKLRRSYTNRYDVQQSSISKIVHNLVGERDDTGEEEVAILPVPRHQTSMQISWTRGGLFLSLDMQDSDDVVRKWTATSHFITEPAANYDLVLGYEFGEDTLFNAPAWMDNFSATLTVNNITDAYAKSTRLNPETRETLNYRVNPVYEWTQGRAYRLSLHKSF